MDDDAPTTALAPRTPARLRLADSLESARLGEVVLLDRRGDIVTRQRRRRHAAAAATLVAAAVGLGVLSGAWGVMLLWGAVLAGTLGLVRRRGRLTREVLPLLAAYRTDEAAARLAAHGDRGTRVERVSWAQLSAGAAWQRGDLAAALDHFDRALTLLGGSRGRWVSAARAMVASSRTMLLWELGERDRAEATMAELAATPPGAWYELRRRAVRLLRAYRLDDDRDLPDDDTLIDWAKGLLRRNHPFPDMALLAWVFERRGDADMVALLLGELAQRLPVPYERLVLMYPSLDPWLGPRLADLPAEPEL